jgi:hypothetical protein
MTREEFGERLESMGRNRESVAVWWDAMSKFIGGVREILEKENPGADHEEALKEHYENYIKLYIGEIFID